LCHGLSRYEDPAPLRPSPPPTAAAATAAPAAAAAAAAGDPVVLYTCNGSAAAATAAGPASAANTLWTTHHRGTNFSISPASNASLCITAPGRGGDGTQLVLQPCGIGEGKRYQPVRRLRSEALVDVRWGGEFEMCADKQHAACGADQACSISCLSLGRGRATTCTASAATAPVGMSTMATHTRLATDMGATTWPCSASAAWRGRTSTRTNASACALLWQAPSRCRRGQATLKATAWRPCLGAPSPNRLRRRPSLGITTSITELLS
jgi:hypothetical protein